MNVTYPIEVTPKQFDFLKLYFDRSTRAVAYGGARKGGKSYVARIASVSRRLALPGTTGLILRLHEEDVIQNHKEPTMDYLRRLGMLCDRDYTYAENESCFTFHKHKQGSIPSQLLLGHLPNLRAARKYQGLPYMDILAEEATQIPTDLLNLVLGSLANEYYPLEIPKWAATCNPGGEYDAGIKQDFIEEDTRLKGYQFIKSRYVDNHFFTRTDPEFADRMAGLYRNQPHILRQWLDGDWDAQPDSFFDLVDSMIKTDEEVGIHIIRDWADCINGLDWGYYPSGFASVWAWKWQDLRGVDHLHFTNELLLFRTDLDHQAQAVLDFEKGMGLKPNRRIAGTDVDKRQPSQSKKGGETIRDVWRTNGLKNVRLAETRHKAVGLALMRTLMNNGTITFSPECRRLIRELRRARMAKTAGGDILSTTDPKQPDDLSDSMRFIVGTEYRNYYQHRRVDPFHANALQMIDMLDAQSRENIYQMQDELDT